MTVTRAQPEKKPSITVLRNGPYRVEGVEDIKDWDGQILPCRPITMLCRCGASKRKPLCDGSGTQDWLRRRQGPEQDRG